MAIAGVAQRCPGYPVNLVQACQSARRQNDVRHLAEPDAAIALLHLMLRPGCSMPCGSGLTVLHKTVAEPH
jgi:hypothetical protein